MLNEIQSRSRDPFPMAALLALAMTGFICILTETIPAGLLMGISADLDISQSMAGQMITVFALGSVISVIPLSIFTQSWNRRAVLLTAIVGFVIFNTVTALALNITLALIARFLAGAAAGLAWSLLAGYARRMVPPQQQGKALAVALIGTPVALALGVPLGTWLGNLLDWRMIFGLMSVMTIGLILWVLASVPDFPGQKREIQVPLLHVFRIPGLTAVILVMMLWMLAHNILYTYIAAFVADFGSSDSLELVLLAFGLASVLGIFSSGFMVDGYLRRATMGGLFIFAASALMFSLVRGDSVVLYVGVIIWGVSFGMAPTLLQTALADRAGSSVDVALSINVVAWNVAIAAGGLFGGVLLKSGGALSLTAILPVILVAALAVLAQAKQGFPSGSRTSTERVGGH